MVIDVERFMRDGFIRVDGAFSQELAAECREILWRASGARRDDLSSWTKPVVRIGQLTLPPFVAATNTPILHDAFDALAGPGRWLPRGSLGTFPLRFPSAEDPGDAGWHIDPSFGPETADYFDWRANVFSKGRALLMLFLFTEVGEDDAPTRIRIGSHATIARRLAPHGEAGLSLRELAATGFAESAHLPVAPAVGSPGTVYLCHPFIVHAAQPHRGREPRFIAQPPLQPRDEVSAESPVRRAIELALE